jgi:hypothetical protein
MPSGCNVRNWRIQKLSFFLSLILFPTWIVVEDDEAEERPLLELSSDGEDQHEAGMYVIFKMIRI